MDTFFEQIVPVKKTGSSWAAVIGIWLGAIVIAGLLFLFTFGTIISSFGFLLMALAFYLAYKLSGKFSIEYEYIITNGILDIDKIMSRSSRKRMLSFNLSTVESVEKYNPQKTDTRQYAVKLFACNKSDPNAYVIIASTEGKGSIKLVMSPESRMKEAMVKFMPKFVSNSAFKD